MKRGLLCVCFIQGYVKKMVKSLHVVDDMSKKVGNFDMLEYKNRGGGFIDNGKNNGSRERNFNCNNRK